MPKKPKATKQSSTKQRRPTNADTVQPIDARERPVVVDIPETGVAISPGRAAEDRTSGIITTALAGDLVGAAARIAGAVLGLGSILLAAPIMVAVPILGALVPNDGFRRLEYRDEHGRVFYYTHTEAPDDAEEQLRPAA